MSKIALTPNAAGTGIFTIASPNSNTDRTLSLPDETGTVLTSGGAIDVNASAPADSLAIDASGNLGIGTSSPTYRLDLSASSGIIARFTGTAAGTGVSIYSSATSYVGDLAALNTVGFNASSNYVSLGTNGTERARITAAGYFKASDTGTYLGTGGAYHELRTSSAGNFYVVNTNASNANGVYVQYSAYSPNGTSNTFLYCEDSTALRMSVRSNGGIANFSANNVNLSDRREKTNFAPAGEYLSKICAIPIQTFNYIDQNLEEDPGLTLGVVAQDVQAVAPELVMESNWGTQEEPKMRLSIYQTDLQYALMKCIQEQQAIIESLKARLDAANL